MANDSDPRVFFAAERTLLAWLRTGLAVIGVGFLVARFGLFLRIARGETHPASSLATTLLGTAFVLLGAAAIALAAWQHRRFVQQLSLAERPRDYGMGWGIGFAFLLAVLGIILAAYLAFGSALGH